MARQIADQIGGLGANTRVRVPQQRLPDAVRVREGDGARVRVRLKGDVELFDEQGPALVQGPGTPGARVPCAVPLTPGVGETCPGPRARSPRS